MLQALDSHPTDRRPDGPVAGAMVANRGPARLDEALHASTRSVAPGTSFQWGVHLANGENCVAAQGTPDAYRGRIVAYVCGSTFRLALLRHAPDDRAVAGLHFMAVAVRFQR
jgi:hypothetical protein